MLGNTIGLLTGLTLIVAVLLMCVCTLGSIVAALRAVSHKSTASTNVSDPLECSGRANCYAPSTNSSIEPHQAA